LILRNFTEPEVRFLDTVIGCAADNEHDKPGYESLEEAAQDLANHWEEHQELRIWTGVHLQVLENYVNCIGEEEIFDPEDVPPECITVKDGNSYWSEAATGRLMRMCKAINYKAMAIARRYFDVVIPPGEQDDIVESS